MCWSARPRHWSSMGIEGASAYRTMDFSALASACAPTVAPELMRAIVRVESGFNPHAIGVVGDALVRQPATVAEAVATVRSLQRDGFNYSIGLAQVNQVHFKRLGWTSDLRKGFDACANLQAGARIFDSCLQEAIRKGYPNTQQTNDGTTYTATAAALNCYYSGDHIRGARLGYVARVLGSNATAAISPKTQRPVGAMMLDGNDKD